MPPVTITEILHVTERAAWRAWLAEHHRSKDEIWLKSYRPATGGVRIPYIAAVEEAICFGWIDGIAKSIDETFSAQRFTPRRPGSNWTELNKERARRLIAAGLMTEAGLATLPDLDAPFVVADDILAALQADPQVWANYSAFPDLYQRVRVSLIEEQRRNPPEFARRLDKFIAMTRANQLYGRWQE
jgi:uncharacterized protein YdeI (YjbR/CyaY-like superfamily)